MNSIWRKEIEKPKFETLSGDAKTDVLIIGGGIVGILCAHFLKQSGINCMLLEANEICSGATKNTTAKITFQHGAIYDKMIKRFGVEPARLYFEAQQDALETYRALCEDIPCDFETSDAYVYSRYDREKIEKEVEAYGKIGCDAEFTKDTELPFSVAGAVKVGKQAQFHPLKFLYAISKDLPIFEHTKVTEFVKPNVVSTSRGKIRAEKIIVATHFPLLNKHGGYFLKLYQHRSYVLALKNTPEIHGMYVDEDEKGLSFRNANDLLLLGGGSHRTGKKGGNWDELSNFAKTFYKDAKEVARWAAQDCMPLDDIPYIGQYSKKTPSLFVVTGFHKWGMTSAMTAATLLCDLILEKENPYEEIFSPSRSILRPQLAFNTAESLLGLLTPTAPRCPHLGCALKYNKQEHSWDCSCHGSRFTEDGEVIDNPSTDDLK